jgi:hypothetical protein
MTSNLPTLALDGSAAGSRPLDGSFRRSYASAGLSERTGSARAFVEGLAAFTRGRPANFKRGNL